MRGRQSRKRGFTLMETVVTVGIIASLAAVVYPQVVKQFDAADPTRLQNDLKNMQTAIEMFSVNTKAFPGDLDDLANAIDAADSSLTTGASTQFLDPSQTGLWNGPYVDFAIVDIVTGGAAESTRPTGFGAEILDSFVCYDTGNDTHGTSVGVATAATDDAKCPGSSGQKFLAIQIINLASSATHPNFEALNELFDGPNEGVSAGTRGRVRFASGGALSTPVVYFLALPLN